MDQLFEKELYETPALGEFQLVEINDRRNLEIKQPAGEQCRWRGFAGSSPLAPTSNTSMASRTLANSS
jgi:hypothetical protein